MNSFFSAKRTGWYVQRFIAEEKIILLISVAVLLLVDLIILMGLSTLLDPNRIFKYEEIRLATFIINLMMISFISIYGLSKKIEKEAYAVHSLMTPNSIFENCLLRIFYIIINLLLVLGVFFIADWITVKYLLNVLFVESGYQLPQINLLDFKYTSFLMVFFILNLLGFIRLTVVKNNLRYFLSIFSIFLFLGINFGLNSFFFDDDGIINILKLPFTIIKLENPTFNKGNFYEISSGVTNNHILMYYMLPIALWCVVIYYFRLKEQEL